jgi:hypothetical protein
MKKIFAILFFFLLISTPAYAWCEFGGFFDWSKEHKACGEYTRKLKKRMNLDQWGSTDAYCSCRIRLYNLKKYGVEKIMGEDEYNYYPGLRSVRP